MLAEKTAGALALADLGFTSVEWGTKLKKAYNGTMWLDWIDGEDYGHVSFDAETGEFIQVHYLA